MSQLFRRSMTSVLLLAALAVAASCSEPPRTPEPWRGCKVDLEAGQLPALIRQADPAPPTPSSQPHCATIPTTAGLPDEPEAVDDLDGLLNRGLVCGPNGHAQVQSVCPAFPAHGWSVVAGPSISKHPPVCPGTNVCPNQIVTLSKAGIGELELEFYDDPSSHRSPQTARCSLGDELSKCYYRLGRVGRQVRL